MKISFAENNTLTGRASRAFGWSFGSTLLTRLGTFGIGIMLARLLGPHAFGTYAVAYVALQTMQTFNELGVSLAIVRWEGDPSGIVPTVTTISMSVSVLAYIACFLSAPAYASAMGAPGATDVVRVLAIGILIDAFCNTPSGVLQRHFRQKQQVIALQVGGWLGTGVTVALAWSSRGAMSLAIGYVVGAAVAAALFVKSVPESLHLGFDANKARALLRFGVPLAGSNLIAFAVTTVDQVIVGHMLGAQRLGYYVLALNIASWPINMFSQPVASVAPAVFARLQHDRAVMNRTFLSVVGLLSGVALPMCLLIGSSGRPLISCIYGTRWLASAEPLIWLALISAMRVFFLVAYDYFVVLARSRFLLFVQITWLLALTPALVIGIRVDGIYGAGLAQVAVAAFAILPFYLGGLRRANVRMSAIGKQFWPAAIGSSITGILAVTISRVAPNAVTALCISGAITVAVVGLLSYRKRNIFRAIRGNPPEHGVPSAINAVGEPPTAGEEKVTAKPIATRRVAEHSHNSHVGRASRSPASQADSLARPAYPDREEPLPIYGDVLYSSTNLDPSATSPLYQLTASFLEWDPAQQPYRHRASWQSASLPGTQDRLINASLSRGSKQSETSADIHSRANSKDNSCTDATTGLALLKSLSFEGDTRYAPETGRRSID